MLLTLPVLWIGERLVHYVSHLSRFSIPVPVVGGLFVAAIVLVTNLATPLQLGFELSVGSRIWNWSIFPEPLLLANPSPERSVYYPFMVAFFSCVGLNASWAVVKRGSWGLLVFLIATTLLAAVQIGVGVSVAQFLGESPLLGLLTGAISLTGGHATSAAFAPLVQDAGVFGALDIAIAAATFGLVAGGLIGGPLGSLLISRHRLSPEPVTNESEPRGASGKAAYTFISQVRGLRAMGVYAVLHALLLLVCLKLGAWVSYFIEGVEIGNRPLVLPGYIGAMLVGVVLRNLLDASGRPWIKSHIISLLMFVCLDLFLAAAVMSINLMQLAAVAVPMLIILFVQVFVMAVFAWFVTYHFMGRDYDAALLAAGHCGFGLGATPNAVANMEALTKRHGLAPRAFLILPFVGGFLLDFPNAMVILLAINFFI